MKINKKFAHELKRKQHRKEELIKLDRTGTNNMNNLVAKKYEIFNHNSLILQLDIMKRHFPEQYEKYIEEKEKNRKKLELKQKANEKI